MPRNYEIQTMKKDIEKLEKKTGAGPPEKLPVVTSEKLPGASLPPEPIESIIPLKPIELPEPPKPFISPALSQSKAEGSSRSIKFFVPIALTIAALLVGAGFYYWWNYMRLPEPARFLKVDEFEIIESLNINIPADISRALGEKYTFFVYKQENRVGFMAEITEREILETGLRDWENTMPEDLRAIFLGQELGESVAEEFQDNLYKGVNIRYLNFTNSAFAIDYAIARDYLVITTSKKSMFKVIDRILGE